jgi:hypothetical protein
MTFRNFSPGAKTSRRFFANKTSLHRADRYSGDGAGEAPRPTRGQAQTSNTTHPHTPHTLRLVLPPIGKAFQDFLPGQLAEELMEIVIVLENE